jgi:DMSO/TMAO reductase YedYZ heme-binding membrane subunit
MTVEPQVDHLPAHRLWQPVTVKWLLFVLGAALAYAVLRYHIAGDVPWRHLPLFIFNKAASMAATIFVACSYLVGKAIRWHNHDPRTKLVVIKLCGLMGFSLAVIHALASFALLNAAYFPKYFAADGRLHWNGELAVMAGVVALWALAFPAITTLPMMARELGGVRWKRSQRMGYVCLFLVVVHLFALGLQGWLTPHDWQWGLPPISLLAVVIATIPLMLKVAAIRRKVSK